MKTIQNKDMIPRLNHTDTRAFVFSIFLKNQVGDGVLDYTFWGRAEDMHMSRPAYKIYPGAPGSDVAGSTVAALAIGAVVFKEKGQRITFIVVGHLVSWRMSR